MNKPIDLSWEFLASEDDARKDISALQQNDASEGDEASDLVDMFNADYVPFEADEDLKWDAAHPVVIKWKVRIDSSKDIEDVIVDKTISVMKEYEEYMSNDSVKDDQNEDDFTPNYNYTMNEEIINQLREVLISEYQKEVPVNFNEIFTIFIDEDDSFGFDIYQLNAINTTNGEVYIIDADSAVKKGVFDTIKTNFENRIQIKTVE